VVVQRQRTLPLSALLAAVALLAYLAPSWQPESSAPIAARFGEHQVLDDSATSPKLEGLAAGDDVETPAPVVRHPRSVTLRAIFEGQGPRPRKVEVRLRPESSEVASVVARLEGGQCLAGITPAEWYVVDSVTLDGWKSDEAFTDLVPGDDGVVEITITLPETPSLRIVRRETDQPIAGATVLTVGHFEYEVAPEAA
jgi:hypothetical protein